MSPVVTHILKNMIYLTSIYADDSLFESAEEEDFLKTLETYKTRLIAADYASIGSIDEVLIKARQFVTESSREKKKVIIAELESFLRDLLEKDKN